MTTPPASPPLPAHVKQLYLTYKEKEDVLARHIIRQATEAGIDCAGGAPFPFAKPRRRPPLRSMSLSSSLSSFSSSFSDDSLTSGTSGDSVVATVGDEDDLGANQLNAFVRPEDLTVGEWPVLVKRLVDHSQDGKVEPAATFEWLWQIIEGRCRVSEHYDQQTQTPYMERTQRSHLHKIKTVWEMLKLLTVRGLSIRDLVCCFLSYFKLLQAYVVDTWKRYATSEIALSTATTIMSLSIELVKDLERELRELCRGRLGRGHHSDLLRIFMDSDGGVLPVPQDDQHDDSDSDLDDEVGAEIDELLAMWSAYPSDHREGHSVAITKALHNFAAEFSASAGVGGMELVTVPNQVVLASEVDEEAQLREMFALVMRQQFETLKHDSHRTGSPNFHSLFTSMQTLLTDSSRPIPSHLVFGWALYKDIADLFPHGNPLSLVISSQSSGKHHQTSSTSTAMVSTSTAVANVTPHSSPSRQSNTAVHLLLTSSPKTLHSSTTQSPPLAPVTSPSPATASTALVRLPRLLPRPLHSSQYQSIHRMTELCVIDWPRAAGLRSAATTPPTRSSNQKEKKIKVIAWDEEVGVGWAESSESESEDEEDEVEEDLGWAEVEEEVVKEEGRPNVFHLLEAIKQELEANRMAGKAEGEEEAVDNNEEESIEIVEVEVLEVVEEEEVLEVIGHVED